MTHITCRLTAKNRDQLRNPTLGNRVWTTFLCPIWAIRLVAGYWKSRSKVNGKCVCYTSIYCGILWWSMAVLVGFHCAVINGKLAWRGVRRGSAEAGSSACGRVNAVGLTSILRRGQFFLVHLLKERPPVTLNSIVYFQFTLSRSLRTPHVSQN